MTRRSVLRVVDAEERIPLTPFLNRLMEEVDRRFGFDFCDRVIIMDDDDEEGQEVSSAEDLVALQDEPDTDDDATISRRLLRLSLFGFCLVAFPRESVAEVARRMPDLDEVDSAERLVERFVQIVSQVAYIKLDEQEQWRSDPKFIVEATKLLPEFLFMIRQVGEDEYRLSVLASTAQLDEAENHETLYQPSFLNENACVVWDERWGRCAFNAQYGDALAEARLRIAPEKRLCAGVLMMRLVTLRRLVDLRTFRAIANVVADEYATIAVAGARATAN